VHRILPRLSTNVFCGHVAGVGGIVALIVIFIVVLGIVVGLIFVLHKQRKACFRPRSPTLAIFRAENLNIDLRLLGGNFWLNTCNLKKNKKLYDTIRSSSERRIDVFFKII